MRILWYSNAPWVGSGYGTQTKLFTPRIKQLGHDVAITAFYGLEGAPLDAGDIPVYPKGHGMGAYGIDTSVMVSHGRHFNADLVISLMDLWVVPPDLGQHIPYAPWFPIDHEPLQPGIARALPNTLMPLVFSHFGERMMSAAGFPYRYLPHGIDTQVFAPKSKAEAREAIGMKAAGIPDDAFIIGMVAANKGSPCRKAIKQQIAAFKKLRQKHSDAILYLHTTMLAGDGDNLPEYIGQLGLPDASVIWTDQYLNSLGMPEPWLRDLYCSLDVLTNVSMGEGFGITILEAQACGTPVLVGDWTSMSELCFSGWMVPKDGAEAWHTPLASYQWWPRVDAIYEQMEAAYLATDRGERGEKARQVALTYDADLITETHWRPVLDELTQMIADRKPKSFQEYLNAAS